MKARHLSPIFRVQVEGNIINLTCIALGKELPSIVSRPSSLAELSPVRCQNIRHHSTYDIFAFTAIEICRYSMIYLPSLPLWHCSPLRLPWYICLHCNCDIAASLGHKNLFTLCSCESSFATYPGARYSKICAALRVLFSKTWSFKGPICPAGSSSIIRAWNNSLSLSIKQL